MRKKKTTEENKSWPRIQAIIDHYHFPSISCFARYIGVNRAENLYQIKRGNNGISREMAEKISGSFPEVSKTWLMTGDNQTPTAPPYFSKGATKIVEIPCGLSEVRLLVSLKLTKTGSQNICEVYISPA